MCIKGLFWPPLELKTESSDVPTGIFFSIFGRGPKAFQIGKISAVNYYFGKFS